MAIETVKHGGRTLYRDVPDGAEKRTEPSGLAVAYIDRNWKQTGKVMVKAFVGNAAKPALYFTTRKADFAEKEISSLFENIAAHKRTVQERREQDQAGHSLKVDDVIVNSWGYDQTNVDAYKVVRATAHFVWLQSIPTRQLPDETVGPMSARCVPVVDAEPSGKIEMHRARGKNVSMKYGSGSIWDGRPMYESWYA
jgi:hypothetical protein